MSGWSVGQLKKITETLLYLFLRPNCFCMNPSGVSLLPMIGSG